MDLELKQKKAIVTGGTGGIGRAIVDLLADEGCDVAVCSRNIASVESTVAETKKRGVRAFGASVDMADGEAVRNWVDRTAEQLGGIDIVVSNVSRVGLDNAEKTWRESFEVDMMGAIILTQTALPYLQKSKCGAIVLITTILASEHLLRPTFAYGGMKASLLNYSKGLATELAPKGIRVNAVSPGIIYADDGPWGIAKTKAPELYAKAIAVQPMGRMGRPDEVAKAAVFLASPVASYITGSNLVVDGGVTHRVQF